MSTMRIWAGSLAAYNAGRLVGAWIDLEGKDPEDVWTEVKDATNDAEEPWVMDIEGFGPFNREMGVGTAIRLAAWAERVEDELGIPGVVALHWIDNRGLRPDADGFTAIRSAYASRHDTMDDRAAVAERLREIHGDEIEKSLGPNRSYYFDWEDWARDALLNGDFDAIVAGGETFLFFNN